MRTTNSRLAKLEEKRSIRKATTLGLLGIVLIALAAVFGIPALVRLAVFIGELNSANRPIDKTDIIAPGPPNLFSQYDATNSATISLTGTTEPGADVFLTKNGEEAGSVVAKDDGVFQMANVTLDDGENIFAAVAIDRGNNRSQPSRPLSVFYSNKQPKLEIEAPTDRQNIINNQNIVDVKGTTDPGSKVTINDRFSLVDAEGKFGYKLNVNEGENTIVIVSMDKAGNTTRKELVVTYNRW